MLIIGLGPPGQEARDAKTGAEEVEAQTVPTETVLESAIGLGPPGQEARDAIEEGDQEVTPKKTASRTPPYADLKELRAKTFVPPTPEEAVEVTTSGAEAIENAPFNQSDAVDTLLGDLIKNTNSPTGEVDEKSLREEIDALLPAIEKDPTAEALQYFLLAAQVADKGVAEGLRDGLPAMIKYMEHSTIDNRGGADDEDWDNYSKGGDMLGWRADGDGINATFSIKKV